MHHGVEKLLQTEQQIERYHSTSNKTGNGVAFYLSPFTHTGILRINMESARFVQIFQLQEWNDLTKYVVVFYEGFLKQQHLL